MVSLSISIPQIHQIHPLADADSPATPKAPIPLGVNHPSPP
jgi:hypothetical protein